MFSITFTTEISKWRNEQYIEITYFTHLQMCLLILRQWMYIINILMIMDLAWVAE